MLAADLLDLVLPARCAGCASPGAVLCPRCAALFAATARPVRPTPAPAGFPQCSAVAAYEGAVRATLIAYKERGRRDVGGHLGRALAESVRASLAQWAHAGPVVLVPVPSRRRAVRQRGTDTTRALATAAAGSLRRVGIDTAVLPALRLRRATADSAGLTAGARAANLHDAMIADSPRRAGRAQVVIVDDLLTTGATVAEAARALGVAGFAVSAAAVVAATARRGLGLPAGAR